MSQRIGIFGGSFDPVHHGHLMLAQDALETLSLDRLLFIPAAINPHKLESAPHASGAQRCAMLQLCTATEPRFLVDPLELERAGPSFTIDTLEILRLRWPDASFFLLLGEDNLPKLHLWHRFEALRSLVTFVTFGRAARPGTAPTLQAPDAGPSSPPSLPDALHLPRRVDLSSTEIRERIAQGRPIRYLVPEPVRLFIQSHALYQPSDQRTAGTPLRPSRPL
jgi:nicotinate-nucleotide adenylyltransferase